MLEVYPGAVGEEVLVARFFLNRRITMMQPWLQLSDSEVFDDGMTETLAEFQRERGIRHEPGYVGAATWDAIALTKIIDHGVRHAPPDGALRNWWAAAAIATSHRRRAHEADCLADDTGVSGPPQTLEALSTFAGRLGWSIHRTNPHLGNLGRHLAANPVIVMGDYTHSAEGPYLHAIVVSALWSVADIPESLVRLHNPNAPGRTQTHVTTFPGFAIGPGHFSPRAILTRNAAPTLEPSYVDALMV